MPQVHSSRCSECVQSELSILRTWFEHTLSISIHTLFIVKAPLYSELSPLLLPNLHDTSLPLSTDRAMTAINFAPKIKLFYSSSKNSKKFLNFFSNRKRALPMHVQDQSLLFNFLIFDLLVCLVPVCGVWRVQF